MKFQNKIVSAILVILSVPTWAQEAPAITQQIQKQLIRHVRENTKNTTTEDIRVSIKNPKQIEKMPKKFTSFKLEIHKKANLIGQSTIPLKFLNEDQKEISEIPIHTEIQVWGKIVRATQLLKKGTQVNTENIDITYQIINTEPPDHCTQQEQVVGKEVAYLIAPGTTLTPRMFRKTSLIKSGDIVYIINSKQGIQLQTKAKALDDGAKGSQIRAKTLLTEPKIIQGEVLDEQHIKMASGD